MLLVQVRFGFIDLKFNCRYSFRPKKKRRNCWFCWWSPLLLLCVYQRQQHPDMEKYILTFVRGSGSVWVYLSTVFRVQVWFRFTEVKFCWFKFGSSSPKWNGLFGFTVRVQVWFDTLFLRTCRLQGQRLQNVSSRTFSRPRTSSGTPPLVMVSYYFF